MSLIAQAVIWNIRPPDHIKRGWKKIVNTVSTDAMKNEWHKEMYPDHFKEGAQVKYDYKSRSAKYLRRKRRRGKNRPMVFSGKTVALTRRFIVITGRGYEITGRLPAPWYVKMRPTTRNAPILGEELGRMHHTEMHKIGKICAHKAVQQIMKRRRTIQRI